MVVVVVVAAVKFVAIVPVSVSMVVVVVAVVDGARAYYIIYAAAASAMVPSFRPGLAASPLYRVAVLCHLLSRLATSRMPTDSKISRRCKGKVARLRTL